MQPSASKITCKRSEPYLRLLNRRPQIRNLLFDPRIHLFDLQFLPTALIPHPSLLQIEIQSNASLRARDLFTQTLLKLLHIRHQAIIISF